MKIVKLIDRGSREVIIFFAGWGADPNPFRSLASERCDVVIIYDYRSISDCGGQFRQLLESYKELHLVAWSMGVWGAAALFHTLEIPSSLLHSSTAINGTLTPIDRGWGIDAQIYQKTIDNIEGGMPRFNLRMCGSKSAYDHYCTSPSQREVGELREELEAIRSQSEQMGLLNSIGWSRAIIADRDMIIPTQSQINFWESYKIGRDLEVKIIEGAHFPFHLYNSWEELIDG